MNPLVKMGKALLILLMVLLAGATTSYAQQSAAKQVVTGIVLDEQGEPVIGASVVDTKTNQGVVTDIDGKFQISVPKGTVLAISYIGTVSEEVKVGNQTNYSIVLKDDTSALDEVVVMGYGSQKKKLVTGATVHVGSAEIARQNTTTVLSALQSQTPGVNITQSTGEPGEGFKVNIRGMGTIGNSTPLYVIDGVAGGDINSLNPADIEAIDVLKDAASSAIYGSRAANGVILITTKQGQSGKVSVSYDGYLGWQNVQRQPRMLTAGEYVNMVELSTFNAGERVIDWHEILGDRYDAIMSGKDKGTDWLNEFRNENAAINNHAVNITGGNDQSKFSMGVSYSSQDGIYGKPVQSHYEHTTARINSDHVIYNDGTRDIVKFGENLYYSYETRNGIGQGDQNYNDISFILRATPLMPLYGQDGNYYDWDDFSGSSLEKLGTGFVNPIAEMVYLRGNNINKTHTLSASPYLQIMPIKGLTFKTQFSYKLLSTSYRSYIEEYELNRTNSRFKDESQVTQTMSSGWSYTWENTLNYVFDIDKHHFDVLVGQSIEKTGMGEQVSATNKNLLFEGMDYAWLSNAQSLTPTASGTPWVQGRLSSFFGRINYNFNETYMLTLIMRRDGSSNFARNNRWGTFPSVSAGWVITNENFMEGTSNWLNFLKLRASWGQNGNCNIDPFQYLSTIAFDGHAGYTFGNNKNQYSQGAYPDILPNPDVTWETSDQTDIGIDSRFLHSRLGVSLDWYVKKTKDWLVQAPILATYGTNAPYINGGDVKNTGFEVALDWHDKIGDEFNYGVNLNFSYNKNEITRIANAEGIIWGASHVLSYGTAPVYRCAVGEPIGYFYGYKTDGIFQNQADIDAWKAQYGENCFLQINPQPGDVKFVDYDQNGVIDENDKTNIGKPQPTWRMGINLTASYKGFDISITGTGAFDQQIARSYRAFTSGSTDNSSTEYFNYWHGEGTSNRYPKLGGASSVNWWNVSDIFIDNADFFRLKDITIGYDFKRLLPKMPLTKARLYASVQNLYTFTGYKGFDPEVGTSCGNESWASGIDLGVYPTPRTFLVGFNLAY